MKNNMYLYLIVTKNLFILHILKYLHEQNKLRLDHEIQRFSLGNNYKFNILNVVLLIRDVNIIAD